MAIKLIDAHLDLLLNEIRNFGLQVVTSLPVSPFEGQVCCYDNGSYKSVYIYLTTWIDIGSIRNILNVAPITLSVINGVATIGITPATAGTSGSMSAADKQKLDNATSTNTSSTLAIRDVNGRIQVSNPLAVLDAVNLQTLNQAITDAFNAFDGKYSVKLSTTAGISNLSTSCPSTVDGVVVQVGDRILVKNQSNAAENGIYVVNAVGTGVNGSWTRADDFNSWTEVVGAVIIVEEGTTGADIMWLSLANQGGTLGTTPITFNTINVIQTYTAGNGMILSGNVFHIGSEDDSIVINADSIRVKIDSTFFELPGAVGISLKNGSITGAKLNPSIFGTGLTFSSGVASVTNYIPITGTTVGRIFKTSITVGGGTPVNVTHSLGSVDHSVELWYNNNPFFCDVVRGATTDTITSSGVSRIISVIITI